MRISIASNSETVVFAGSELRKYLKMMLIDRNVWLDPDGELTLGTFTELGINCDIKGDIDKDDIIYIKTSGEKGVIAGNNYRSVLLAVYEYLRHQGCRWLFPGVDGEYIPEIDKVCDVTYSHKMSSSIRGQCIEGAVSQENVLSAIDFAPKIGLNSFMLECYSPLGYYNKWYTHRHNDLKQNEEISDRTALQWKRQCESEIEKRGLLYHDMGHGWTTLAFGFNHDTNEFCAENLGYLAEIDGKREIYKNSPLDTNFCMSNDAGRKKLIKFIADYAERHNNVNFLHLWLADGTNNHCECSDCMRFIPSELYVRILNELDKELSERNISTKIVFLSYNDLLWAPEKVNIENPDRFIHLFAPITRNYFKNYGVNPDMTKLKKYERNNLKMPESMGENLAYLEKWREKFTGDIFCYEYHFYKVCFFDFSSLWLAENVFNDAKGLKSNHMCGMIEDQSQRNAYPTGLPIYAWSKALCDEKISFKDVLHDYFCHSFGNEWEMVYEFLNEVSTAFSPEYMLGCFDRGENLKNEEIHLNMTMIKKRALSFKNVCESKILSDIRCQSVAWQQMYFHCDFCVLASDVFSALSNMDYENTFENADKLFAFLAEKEDFFQKYFDLFLFRNHFESALNKLKK